MARRTRLIRVDEKFYKRLKELSEKTGEPMTKVTRMLDELLAKLEKLVFTE